MLLKYVLSLTVLTCLLQVTVVSGQRVNVTIFMESQCPYCTRLLREQIWPFQHKYPQIMNLQIVAFGKGNCDYFSNRTLHCHCMHGPHECDLNRLQNCAMSYFPRRYLGLVTCIQGLSSLQEAFVRCLSRLTPRTQRRLIKCSTTQAGELLNYYSMVNTHRAGIKLWPTMYVNGRFFDRSYPAEYEICRYTSWC
uniref:Gamma interferon inducible lysosomal thiol reductase n=1 Tax=Syphacia muris TaxID=451379 RepID=A0A0N5B083_9BILA